MFLWSALGADAAAAGGDGGMFCSSPRPPQAARHAAAVTIGATSAIRTGSAPVARSVLSPFELFCPELAALIGHLADRLDDELFGFLRVVGQRVRHLAA